MWKAKPIVASAVGGIVDQIVSGEHGLLVDDPRDPVEFGHGRCGACSTTRRYAELLAPTRGAGDGEFLGDRHLEQTRNCSRTSTAQVTAPALPAHRRSQPCGLSSMRKTGWSGLMRRSSSSDESPPTPPKKTPTSAFQRLR